MLQCTCTCFSHCTHFSFPYMLHSFITYMYIAYLNVCLYFYSSLITVFLHLIFPSLFFVCFFHSFMRNVQRHGQHPVLRFLCPNLPFPVPERRQKPPSLTPLTPSLISPPLRRDKYQMARVHLPGTIVLSGPALH